MDAHCSYTSFARPSFPPWWSPHCQKLFLQKKFLLKKDTFLISLEFWSKYKRTVAKLRQVFKEAKRHFWNSGCSKAQEPRILYHTLGNFRTRSSTSPDSHYILQKDDTLISHAYIQSEILIDHFSTGGFFEPLPLDFSENKSNYLNTSFSLFELQDANSHTKKQLRVKAKFQPFSLKISVNILRFYFSNFTTKTGKHGKFRMTGNLLQSFLSANQARQLLTDP